MWVFYYDVVGASSAQGVDVELGIATLCLALAGIFWFVFTRWCGHESR